MKGTRYWKDPVSGKRRQQTRSFIQTINPFNKNSQGLIKTRYEIVAELVKARSEWIKAGDA